MIGYTSYIITHAREKYKFFLGNLRKNGWDRLLLIAFYEKKLYNRKNECKRSDLKMIDINLIRTNPELVKENIKKKFQDAKLPLVDEALALDTRRRALIAEGDALRASRNTLSKQVGMLMKEGKKDEAEEVKAQVKAGAERLVAIEKEAEEVDAALKKTMMTIPNIIAGDVPLGKDDSENVELQRFGEAKEPDFEIPYHLDILENLDGIDVDSARRTSGQGFYYLTGDIARLHSAVLTYARDFMIDKGFTYVIPPYMILGDVV